MEGEKPTRLFCALEKHNGSQKHVPKLNVEKNGRKEVIIEQEQIEEEIFNYYQNLFAEREVGDIEIEEFLLPEIADLCPKISEDQKEKMEGLLTTDELTKYLKKTKNNTAPGSSGFTNEFFKFFLD